MKYALITILINLSSISFTQKISHNQKVFPEDINNYSLVFVSDIKGDDNVHNPEIQKFIEKEQGKGVQYFLSKKNDLATYPVEEYKYAVLPFYVDRHGYLTLKPNNISYISYLIMDRVNDYKYQPYWAGVHPRKITRDFLKSLNRITNNLKTIGIEKTFKKEYSRTNTAWKIMAPLLVAGLIAIPVVGYIIG